ncbi:hypothetical protein [Akkermansia sp.]|uniref:hypothetical protein n=1 Tax=Akkermansia sp. TaxID=1872421 RepID=UPI0025BC6E16|nr:hypothetical protein [Akkermansia sp.]
MMKVPVLLLSLVAACVAGAEILPFSTPCFDTRRCADKAKSSLSMEQKETCVGVKLADGKESMDIMIPFRDKNNYSNLAVFEKAFAKENIAKKLDILKKAEPRLVKTIIRGKEVKCPVVPLVSPIKGEDGLMLALFLASYEKIDFKAQQEGRFQKKRNPDDIKFVYGVIFEVSDPVSKKKVASPIKWEQAETVSAWIDAVRKEVKQ